MAYYSVMVKFEQMFEVLVKADNEKQAKEKAMSDWGAEDPVFSETIVYDINELGVKHD
jgi:hypothetical protein